MTELAERAPKRRRSSRQRKISMLWVLPAVLVVLAVHYVAVGAGGWYAFTNWNGITAHARYIGLGNFREILRDPAARGSLENTLKLAFAFVIVVNSIGLALAVALNKTLRLRNWLRALFFAPVVLSPLAVSFVWQYIFDYNGPLNHALKATGLGSLQQAWTGDPSWAIWTIFVVLVWQFAGLTMVIYLAGLQSIPEELDEAGAVDGASGFYRFRRVTLPLLAPALTISMTLTLINGLRVFDQVLGITGGGPVNASQTLASEIWQQTFVFGRFGYGAALALVLTVLIAVFAVAQVTVLRFREKRIAG